MARTATKQSPFTPSKKALKQRLQRTAELVCGVRSEVFKQRINALSGGKDHSIPDDLLNPIFRVSDNAESPT